MECLVFLEDSGCRLHPTAIETLLKVVNNGQILIQEAVFGSFGPKSGPPSERARSNPEHVASERQRVFLAYGPPLMSSLTLRVRVVAYSRPASGSHWCRRTAKSNAKGSGPCFRPTISREFDSFRAKNGPDPGLCSSPGATGATSLISATAVTKMGLCVCAILARGCAIRRRSFGPSVCSFQVRLCQVSTSFGVCCKGSAAFSQEKKTISPPLKMIETQRGARLGIGE